MIALLFIIVSLIIPNVYAQDKYNPTQDTYDNLINVLLPLLIIAAYRSRMKNIVGMIEGFALYFFVFVLPPIYNYVIYKNTSTYDYVCFISSLITLIRPLLLRAIDRLVSIVNNVSVLFCFPSISFSVAIYWIEKDVTIEKIGYELFIVISSILMLIVIILSLFGHPFLGIYFYIVVSVGLTFSIVYSNSFLFAKLVLAIMSYFLARIFDEEVYLGKRIKTFDEEVKTKYVKYKFLKYFVKVKKRMLRFYIDEAKGFNDKEITFSITEFHIKVPNERESDERVTVWYDSAAPREAYYFDINTTVIHLNINVDGRYEKFPLDGVQKGTLVQTPKLLDEIILTMTLVDEENE